MFEYRPRRPTTVWSAVLPRIYADLLSTFLDRGILLLHITHYFMNFRKLGISFLIAVILISPSTASAATTAELQVQVNMLIRMLADLRAQLAQVSIGASNASSAPSCTLTATPNAADYGDRVTVSWTSTNATRLSWIKDTSGKDTLSIPSGRVMLNGSKRVKMDVIGNPSLRMKVVGPGGASTCSVTIPVDGSNISSERTSEAVSCVLSTDKSSYTLGDMIRLTWNSNNASVAGFEQDNSGKDTLVLPGDKLDSSGSIEVEASVIGNPIVQLKALGVSGNASCSTKVRIEE